MPRVIPGGGPDTTSQFLLQITHGNQALARLYATLLAKYEDRLEQQAFQREMFGARTAEGDRRRDEANREWYNREDYKYDRRNPPAAATGPNLLGPGAAGSPAPATPAAAPPPRAAEAPIERPSVYTLDKNPYSGSGAGTSAPVAPAPKVSDTGVSPKVAALLNSGAADAQASGAGHTEFSAQSRKPLPTVEQPPRTPRREPPSNTQLPTQPRPPTARTAATRPQADYLDIDQRWLDLMHTEEDKHKLPRGTLMTIYGIENGGGRQFGRNKRATGIFQFHDELRAQYKLSEEDTRDPAKMIPIAAANVRRNADVLERNHKITLPLTPQAIPMFVGLHQWGVGAGPRIVAAYIQNPEVRMADKGTDGTPIMGTHRDANGNVLDNYTILASNGHDPNITVGGALRNKAVPWYSKYTQQFPDHAHQPQGKYVSTPAPQTQTPQVGDPNAPRPPAPITGRLGVREPVERFMNEITALYPQIRITSGYRDPGHNERVGGARGSQHVHRNAFDASLSGLTDAEKADVITRARRSGAMGIGNYGGDSIHLDWRSGGPAAWGPNRSHTSLGRTPAWFQQQAVAHLQGQPPPQVQTAAAPAPAAAPQPVRVAGPLPPREEPTRPYVTSAISRIPTSGEVGATFAARDKAPAAEAAAPPLDIPPISTPIKAGVGTSAARSDPYYNLQNDIGEGIPTLDTRNVPMPPERPITESGDLGGVGTPADAPLPGLDEQLDIQTNAPQVPLPPLKPPEPEFTPAERTPMVGAPATLTGRGEHGQYGDTPPDSVQDAMADAFRQRTEPGYKTADFNVIPQVAVGDLPPQGEISTTAKQPLPAEFDVVTPAQRTPPPADFTLSPQLDVPTTVARAPLPPGFKVPLPTLGGDAGAAASVSTNQMPRDLQQPLPARLPPPLPPEVSSGNAPTLRSIIDAIYSGNIPKLSTATDPNAVNVYTPPPEIPEQQLAETLAIPKDKLQAVGEWLKQNFGPGGQPDNQKVFNEAMQQYVRSGVNAVSDWWNRPSAPAAKPTTQSGPPAPPVAAQPAPRTMPNGQPYFPPPEPLVVPPRPGAAGPANTTLSGGSSAPLPAPPGQYNPMTGRIDIPAPDTLQDGTKKFYEPGEQPVE